MPSTNVPVSRDFPILEQSVLRACQFLPYPGVNLPRTSPPKSTGESRPPISCSLIQIVISEGQFFEVSGVVTELRNTVPARLPVRQFVLGGRLFGELYSTKPRSNQSRLAVARFGFKNVSGTSRYPIISSVEHKPQGGVT